MIKKLVLYTAIPLITTYLIVIFLENIIYYNPSISEPIGYYFAVPGNYVKNDLVFTCISNSAYKPVFNQLGMMDNGACKNGLPYLLKRIVAVDGDKVEIVADGVLINGVLQINSYQFAYGNGVNLRPLPVGWSRTLKSGEYFVLGESPHSVDSRYFGLVYREDIYRRAIKFK